MPEHVSEGLEEIRPPFPEQHLEGTGDERKLVPRPRFAAPLYRAAGKLEGKVAIITGGDSGIGRAVAALYAREGADVGIIYLTHDEDAALTRQAVEECDRRCVLKKGDVGDFRFCREAVDDIVAELGRLDILVSNAGYQRSHSDVEGVDELEIERTFRTNVFGYFHMVKASLRYLQPGAAIIATGSETGIFGAGALLDYSASKGAIHALTKSLARNLLPRGIRVNAVAPGPVWTPLNPADAGLTPRDIAHFGESTELGRPAQPDEIAPAYVFLASPADSSFMTGQIIAELGGVSA